MGQNDKKIEKHKEPPQLKPTTIPQPKAPEAPKEKTYKNDDGRTQSTGAKKK